MNNLKEDFYYYQAQTTPFPIALEIHHAKGNYLYGKNGEAYLDFVAGVSVNTLGHGHPSIIKAIKEQLERYTHVMVYGEFIQEVCVKLCKKLAEITPFPLSTTYLVNSGTEAIEGALKLAKRFTGRQEVVSCNKAYHGNTQGAMSLMGEEAAKNAFRPLIPGVKFIEFNKIEDLDKINEKTACAVIETIQGAAGFIKPKEDYLAKVKKKCEEKGALLIVDEIQPGFGRTGKFFSFEHYHIVPDIVVMGKGMASGMPIGAFMSSFEIMSSIAHNPMLGHITTFGGNPVVAAAALATINEIFETDLMGFVDQKEFLFREILIHPEIKSIKGKGLMLACQLKDREYVLHIAKVCREKGLLVFWLLFAGEYLRISPPLTITNKEIQKGCEIILNALTEFPSS